MTTLSEKIFLDNDYLDVIEVKDAKEKLQNLQRRLKEAIDNTDGTCDNSLNELPNKIDKIFREEIGRKLLE